MYGFSRRSVEQTMATAFYWRRRNMFGIALFLFGIASIIEIIPLLFGQYFLLIDRFEILLAPSLGAVLAVFMLLLSVTESITRGLHFPLTRLLRPTLYSIIIVAILRYLTFFIGLSVFLPFTLNWVFLDSPTWSYILSHIVGIISSVVLTTRISIWIEKPR